MRTALPGCSPGSARLVVMRTRAGRLIGRQIADATVDPQRQPLAAAGARLDQLDDAAHLGGIDLLVQHRRAHPFDAQLGERKAERGGQQRGDEQG